MNGFYRDILFVRPLFAGRNLQVNDSLLMSVCAKAEKERHNKNTVIDSFSEEFMQVE